MRKFNTVINGYDKQEVNQFVSEVTNEYDNISEAVRNTDIKTQAIRVINNTSFQVGMVHSILSECSADNKVFDLKTKDNLTITLLGGFVAYSIQAFANISVIHVAPIYYIIIGLILSQKPLTNK